MEIRYKTENNKGYSRLDRTYHGFESDYLKSFRDLRYKESKRYEEIKG